MTNRGNIYKQNEKKPWRLNKINQNICGKYAKDGKWLFLVYKNI